MTRTLLALLCLAVLALASPAVADTTDLPPPDESSAVADIANIADYDFKINYDRGGLDLETAVQGYADRGLFRDLAVQRCACQTYGIVEANHPGGNYDQAAIFASTFDRDFKDRVNFEREDTSDNGYWRRE